MRNTPVRGLAALMLAAGLGACAASTTTDTAPAATPSATSGYGSMETNAAGGHSIQIAGVNNSGFGGTAVLTDMGGKTNVVLTLNSPANTDAEADHNANIHTGTCAAPGVEVKELSDVEGNGKASTTEVDLAVGTLMDGNHIIAIKEIDGDRPVACVDIPRN